MTNNPTDCITLPDVMRRHSRELTASEQAALDDIKYQANVFYYQLQQLGPKNSQHPGGSRELSLALTKVEEAVMWAVKHVTK